MSTKSLSDSHSHKLSRRQLLTGVTALAATAAAPARQAAAQSGGARPHRIDVHHHYTGDWAPAKTIEGMDQNGIATAILSRPGIPFSDVEKARKLARETNDRGAQLVPRLSRTASAFSRRSRSSTSRAACTKLPTPSTCSKPMACVSSPATTGIRERNGFGDAAYAPVFDELHLGARPSCSSIRPCLRSTTPISGFKADRRAGSRRQRNGPRESVRHSAGRREPDYQRHADPLPGHPLHLLPWRRRPAASSRTFESPARGESVRPDRRKLPVAIRPEWVRQRAEEAAFRPGACRQSGQSGIPQGARPPERLLFGSDYPPVPIAETAGNMPGLRLDAKLLRAIERDNALTLFPRFKT